MIENGHLTVREIQVAVVVNQDMRQMRDGDVKIGKRSRKPGPELVVWNIMTALRNAHRHPLGRLLGAGEADVTQHDDVAAPGGFCQKCDLVAHRIGEYRLEDKTLTTPDQCLS